MRDRNVGESLTDHADAVAADLLDRRRLEHAARAASKAGVVERRLLGEENVLRQELALEAFKVVAQRFSP